MDPLQGLNIQLGQGFYVPADPIEQAHQIDIFRFCLMAACGALIWEHIVTIHEELNRWKQLFSGRPTWVGCLVLVARYSIWGSAVSTFWFFFPPSNHVNCQASIYILFVFIAINYICLANVFVLRVKALWAGSGNRWVAPFLYSCMLVVSCAWCASVAGFHGSAMPEIFQQRYGPRCMPSPAPYWRVLGWACAAVFDIVIYVMTLVKLQQLRSSPAADFDSIKKLQNFVMSSSTLYFAVSFSCNVLCVFMLTFYRNLILSNIPIVLSAIMNAIIACRVVFHSDLFTDGKTGLLVIDPLRRRSNEGRNKIIGRPSSMNSGYNREMDTSNVPVVVYAGGAILDDTSRAGDLAFGEYEKYRPSTSGGSPRSESEMTSIAIPGGPEFVSSSSRSIYAESYRSKSGAGAGAGRKADYASSLNSDIGGAYYTPSNHTFGHGGADNVVAGAANHSNVHLRSNSMPLERNTHPYSAAAYQQDDRPNQSAATPMNSNGSSTARNGAPVAIRMQQLQQSPAQMNHVQLLRIAGPHSSNGHGSTKSATASSITSKSRSSPSRMGSLRGPGTTTPEMTREVVISVSGPSSRATAAAAGAPTASAPALGPSASSSPYTSDTHHRIGEDEYAIVQPPLSRCASGNSIQQGRPIRRLPRPPSS